MPDKSDNPQTTPCIGNDPACPCQDGDACHYVDLPGSPAMKPKPLMPETTISQLEIEAVVLGLKAISEDTLVERHRDALTHAVRLIRVMDEKRKAEPPDRRREIEELARGIQIAHAAWVAMGAPGAWEEVDV